MANNSGFQAMQNPGNNERKVSDGSSQDRSASQVTEASRLALSKKQPAPGTKHPQRGESRSVKDSSAAAKQGRFQPQALQQSKHSDTVMNLDYDGPPVLGSRWTKLFEAMKNQGQESLEPPSLPSTDRNSKKRKTNSEPDDDEPQKLPLLPIIPGFDSQKSIRRPKKVKESAETQQRNARKAVVGEPTRKPKPSGGRNLGLKDSSALKGDSQVADGSAESNSKVAWPLSLYYTKIFVGIKEGTDLGPILDDLCLKVQLFHKTSLLPTDEALELLKLVSTLAQSYKQPTMVVNQLLEQLDVQLIKMGAKNWTQQQDIQQEPRSLENVFVELKHWTNQRLAQSVDPSKLDDNGRASLVQLRDGIDNLESSLEQTCTACEMWQKESRDLQMRCAVVSSNLDAMAYHLPTNTNSAKQFLMDSISSLLTDIDSQVDALSPAITIPNSKEAVVLFKNTLRCFVMAKANSF